MSPFVHAPRVVLVAAALAMLTPAMAQADDCAATETMRGGRNNYIPDAPTAPNLGTGFTVSGIVRRAGSCEPLPDVRVQIWLATARGGERHDSNRASTRTDAAGRFVLETSAVVPQFGQPHIHIAYDDPGYGTLFLRPVLDSPDDTSITVDFVLAPDDASS